MTDSLPYLISRLLVEADKSKKRDKLIYEQQQRIVEQNVIIIENQQHLLSLQLEQKDVPTFKTIVD